MTDAYSALEALGIELMAKSRTPDLDGYKPLPHQVQYHQDPHQGRINFGGNRSGKSYSSVVEMVWWATGTHPYRQTPRPPLRLRHVAVDSPMGINKILKELYKQIVPKRLLRGGSFEAAWQNQPAQLNFSNGSEIEFLSYEQDLDKHAGVSRHAIAFDEEPDEAIFNENMARLVDTDGQWWIAMTPLEGLTWVYHRFWLPFEEGSLENKEDVGIHKFRSRDNTYIPKGAIERLLAGLSEDERRARLEGDFMALSGLIYPFRPEVHVISVEPQPNLLTITGMDHGLRNPTAWLWTQIDSDGNYYIVKEHYARELYVEEHAAAVKVIESGNRFLRPAYRVGDPSIVNRLPIASKNQAVAQSVQSEYALHGITIAPGNNDVDAGINRVAGLFSLDENGNSRLHIDPSCRNFIKECRTYRWDEWATRKMQTTKQPKATPRKADDHAMDAFRYLVMSRPLNDTGSGRVSDPEPTEFQDGTGVRYATPSTRKYDHRNTGAYDDTLGTEW